ncbi:GroES-like protein [Aspergillus crustosus]
MTAHLAAVTPGQGQPFEVHPRPTPAPGPGELLIAIKSIALNPADTIMRATGLFIQTYPTVIGFDLAGLVLKVGANVPDDFQAGRTRIAAYAASAWRACNLDYGAFQEYCLVPWQHALRLPEEGISLSWNEAATLPVAGQVPLSAWDALGIPRVHLEYTTAVFSSSSPLSPVSMSKQEVLLIWGASSSVGTMGVQAARILRDDPNSCFGAVYATAGAANQEYVASLGADRVFDYNESHVVESIVSAAKEDGLVIRHCFLAMGELAACQAVLKPFVEQSQSQSPKSKIGSAPPVPSDAEEVHGIETIFVMPSSDEEKRLAQFQYWMGTLTEYLAKGVIRPSPELKVVGRGLGAINEGLDMLSRGVSCTKLVVEVAE